MTNPCTHGHMRRDRCLECQQIEILQLKRVLQQCRNLGNRMAETKGDEYAEALKALINTLYHWDVDRLLSGDSPAAHEPPVKLSDVKRMFDQNWGGEGDNPDRILAMLAPAQKSSGEQS